MSSPIPVYLTHACPIMRAGLAAILEPHAEFAISKDARCPCTFTEAAIIVTDYASGLLVAAQSLGHAPKVLVLTNHNKEWEVRQAVSNGVNGFLEQSCPAEELVRCMHLLRRGRDYLSAAASRSVVNSLGREHLTPRELDVLRVLAWGVPDKEIARQLGIGAGTVKSHIKNLLSKLNASARTHAVVVAMQRGLLSEHGDVTPSWVRTPPGHAIRGHAGFSLA